MHSRQEIGLCAVALYIVEIFPNNRLESVIQFFYAKLTNILTISSGEIIGRFAVDKYLGDAQ